MILLIPVLALFTGSARLASICTKMACGTEYREVAKAPKKNVGSVVHCGCKAKAGGCGQTCHKGQKEKEGKGKDGGGSCVDCPLCCLVTLKPFFRWEMNREVTIIDYAVMSDNNLSDYFKTHWKPPSAPLIS